MILRGKSPKIRRQAAFTIIEILIVVAIISMLAMVGVIQVLRARIITHEQLAITSIREIGKAAQFFFLANQAYPASLVDLDAPISDPPYLHASLVPTDPAANDSRTEKQGYEFVYANPNPDIPANPLSFRVLAKPLTPSVTGIRTFYNDHTGIVTFETDGTDPGPNDPSVQ